MQLRLVDNKRIQMTKEEYELYQKICNSYPQGKELFRGLFETDKDGLILFLYPPEKEFSMEVVLFLQNLMVQQHLRKLYANFDEAIQDIQSKFDAKIESLKEELSKK